MAPRQLERRVTRLEKKVKSISDVLELSPTVTSFKYKDFNIQDRNILRILFGKGRDGATTTQIAEEMRFSEPEATGRVTVYRRLKRIARITTRIRGFPFIISEHKRWILNFDDFSFQLPEAELEIEDDEKEKMKNG